MNIETSRLLIKPIDRKSLIHISKYLKDLSLNTIIPKDLSNHHIKKFLASNEKIRLFNSLGYFSVHLKKTHEIIGLVSVIPRYLGETLVNELSYLISGKYQNNNFASEVILNVVNFIFSKTNIDSVCSLVDENNMPSIHILEDKMKFDFVNMIIDSNGFKSVYTLDKVKFRCAVKPFNHC